MNRLEVIIARKLAGLSQNALAKEAGISRQYLNAIEGGKRPMGKKITDKLIAVFRKHPPLISTSTGRGVDCPQCGGLDLDKLRDGSNPQDMVWHCRGCGKTFTTAESWHLERR